jgi:holo-[acyl-carrier protein] synthase
VRVGVDLVDVAAFQARFDGRDDLLADTFSPAELAYCRAQKSPWTHLAARFAAREAALKALGTGLAGKIAWRDVEVTRDPAGAPGLVFGGALGEALDRAGLKRSTVSLSHTNTYAIAVVALLEG